MRFKVSKKTFAHIDCDSFFVACEVFRNPALANKHVCVGKDVTIAASYSAKAKWVKVWVPFWEAKKILWKDFVPLVPDMRLYGTISKKLMTFLREHTQNVEEFSIDEAFVEITGLPESMGMTLEEYVKYLQNKILQEIGVPVSFWVSTTRLRAKIFSKVRKPFGYFIAMDNQSVYDQFQEMPVSDIPFVGFWYQQRLAPHIKTIYDFSRESMFYFKRLIGKNATGLWFELNGVNSLSFASSGDKKSVVKTRSFNDDKTSDPKKLWTYLLKNIERLFEDMALNEFEIRNIKLYLKTKEKQSYSTIHFFDDYTCDRKEIYSALQKLFIDLYIPGTIYRTTWVGSHDLQKYSPKQLSIFSENNAKHEKNIKLEKIFIDIHKKYGNTKIKVGI